jgi:hypothetical protein
MTSTTKLACNLDKALSTIRYQGVIKTAKRPQNPTKTYLRHRHHAKKYLAKTYPYQAPGDNQELMTKVQQK